MPEPSSHDRQSQRHARLVEATARAVWGKAWALLSDEQRAGALALAALGHLAGQDEDVSDAKVRALLLDLHAMVIATRHGPADDAVDAAVDAAVDDKAAEEGSSATGDPR